MAGNNTAKVVVFIVMGAALALGAGIAYMNRQEAPEPKPVQQAQTAEAPTPVPAPVPAPAQPEPDKQAPKAENVTDPYAASSDPHKVTTDSEAGRVAKLGRSVPMEGQQGEPAQEPAQAVDQPGLPAGLWTVRQPGGERPAPAPAVAEAPAPEAATPAPAASVEQAEAPEPAKPAKARKPEKPAMAEKAEKAQKPEKPAAPGKKEAPAEAPAKVPAEAKQAPASAPAQAPAKADAADAGALAAGKILEVTAKTVSGALVLTVVTDAPVEKVLTARYKGPARVVVDVVGHWQGGVKPSLASEADFVEKVRLGMHPDRLRIVFDYRNKQSEGGAEPRIEKQAKGVVITLPPSN